MNWYKKAQQIAPLGATDQGKLTLRVNGEVKEYQLPYSAVGSYRDIVGMLKKKQNKKLDQYLQWLEQFKQEYKVAQTYEDVTNYPDEHSDGEGDLNAYRYFSIGQNEETTNDSFCWIWMQNQLRVAEGPTTHGSSFGRLIDENDRNGGKPPYKGWYDPTQNLLSVVTPNYREGIKSTEEDLPSPLRRSLYRKFGQDAQMILF